MNPQWIPLFYFIKKITTMKTLNDKRLEKANNSKDKKNRIKEHRNELNNNQLDILENAWNRYILLFWNNWINWIWDKVVVDNAWFIYWIRTDLTKDHDIVLTNNASMWIYWCTKEKLQQMFFEITEWFFNS